MLGYFSEFLHSFALQHGKSTKYVSRTEWIGHIYKYIVGSDVLIIMFALDAPSAPAWIMDLVRYGRETSLAWPPLRSPPLSALCICGMAVPTPSINLHRTPTLRSCPRRRGLENVLIAMYSLGWRGKNVR